MVVLAAHPIVRPMRERVLVQARGMASHGGSLLNDILKDEPVPVPKGWSNAVVPQAPMPRPEVATVVAAVSAHPVASASVRVDEAPAAALPHHNAHASTAPRAAAPVHRAPSSKKRH